VQALHVSLPHRDACPQLIECRCSRTTTQCHPVVIYADCAHENSSHTQRQVAIWCCLASWLYSTSCVSESPSQVLPPIDPIVRSERPTTTTATVVGVQEGAGRRSRRWMTPDSRRRPAAAERHRVNSKHLCKYIHDLCSDALLVSNSLQYQVLMLTPSTVSELIRFGAEEQCQASRATISRQRG
jgi:hypothetical protein